MFIPDKINKSTSKTKFSVSRHSGSTDPDAVLKAEFEDKVAKRIQATENHEFLKWTDLKKICIEIRDMDTRIDFIDEGPRVDGLPSLKSLIRFIIYESPDYMSIFLIFF